MFHHGNLKDYLLKVLNHLQHLIIVLVSIKLLWYQNKSKIYWKLFKTTKNSYTHGKVVNIYIVYELGASSSHNNDPTLKNCLFGAVTLTKNSDIDKYGYSGYGIGFDRRSSLSFPGT